MIDFKALSNISWETTQDIFENAQGYKLITKFENKITDQDKLSWRKQSKALRAARWSKKYCSKHSTEDKISQIDFETQTGFNF